MLNNVFKVLVCVILQNQKVDNNMNKQGLLLCIYTHQVLMTKRPKGQVINVSRLIQIRLTCNIVSWLPILLEIIYIASFDNMYRQSLKHPVRSTFLF